MNNIPIPAAGQDILPWASAVTSALAPAFSPARGLARSGPTGAGAEPLPENLRNRNGAVVVDDLGTFRLSVVANYAEAQEGEDPELVSYSYSFSHCWFLCGAMPHLVSGTITHDIDVEDFDDGGTDVPRFLCLSIPASWPASGQGAAAPSIVDFTQAAFLSAAASPATAIIPLYMVLRANIMIDFRKMPVAPVAELL